ncbi:MAG: TlpA family protein disulfide reductase [Planctomycetes bacterium]|nr:TlpA family protein disulfide reductase [Planctomycetota bacterium]
MRLPHLLVVILCLAFVPAAAAQKEKLKEGSNAPGLDIEEWVLGEEIEIKKDNIYVVVFFTTDCIECRQVFPILSEIQEMHEDSDVHVIAISPEDKRTVKRFVRGMSTDIKFRVGIDRRNSSERAWKNASGIKGLPAIGFIVDKKMKVQYLGLPGTIEFMRVLLLVIEGRYDARLWKKAEPLLEAARDARKVRNWRKAHQILDEVIKADPEIFAFMTLDKFEMQLVDESDPEAAYTYAKKLLLDYGDDPQLLARLAQKIATDTKIPDDQRDLVFALSAAETAAQGFETKEPERYAVPALVHYRAGRTEQAIKLQKRAYRVARPMRKPYYKRVLKEYQSGARDRVSGAKKKQ